MVRVPGLEYARPQRERPPVGRHVSEFGQRVQEPTRGGPSQVRATSLSRCRDDGAAERIGRCHGRIIRPLAHGLAGRDVRIALEQL